MYVVRVRHVYIYVDRCCDLLCFFSDRRRNLRSRSRPKTVEERGDRYDVRVKLRILRATLFLFHRGPIIRHDGRRPFSENGLFSFFLCRAHDPAGYDVLIQSYLSCPIVSTIARTHNTARHARTKRVHRYELVLYSFRSSRRREFVLCKQSRWVIDCHVQKQNTKQSSRVDSKRIV